MLLYILWTIPRNQEHMHTAINAVYSCADTLSHFAERWPDAIPYATVFRFLIQRLSMIDNGPSPTPEEVCSVEELEDCLAQLKKQYIYKVVLDMIQDMAYQPVSCI